MTACDCSAFLLAEWRRLGVEVHVQPLPETWVDTEAFPAFAARCPHGTWWIAEPTGEQHAEWARTETA